MGTGHSLGAATSIILSLLLKLQPEKYKGVRAIVIAPPTCLSKEFIQNNPEKVNHILGVIYNKDMIPRLTIRSVAKIKTQMRKLLPLSRKPNLWIMNNSVNTTPDTIKDCLGRGSPYVFHEAPDPATAWNTFDEEVEEEVCQIMDGIVQNINL